MVPLLALLCLLFVGCASPPPPNPISIDEPKALQIAQQAIASQDPWMIDRVEFDKPQQNQDGSWVVLARRLPKHLGGRRIIVIDPSGRVIAYNRSR